MPFPCSCEVSSAVLRSGPGAGRWLSLAEVPADPSCPARPRCRRERFPTCSVHHLARAHVRGRGGRGGTARELCNVHVSIFCRLFQYPDFAHELWARCRSWWVKLYPLPYARGQPECMGFKRTRLRVSNVSKACQLLQSTEAAGFGDGLKTQDMVLFKAHYDGSGSCKAKKHL